MHEISPCKVELLDAAFTPLAKILLVLASTMTAPNG